MSAEHNATNCDTGDDGDRRAVPHRRAVVKAIVTTALTVAVGD